MGDHPRDDIRGRLRAILRKGAPGRRSPEFQDLITDGCARALLIETESLQLGQRISELAVDVTEPANAQELRRLWLRRRNLTAELHELRSLLQQLTQGRSSAPVS